MNESATRIIWACLILILAGSGTSGAGDAGEKPASEIDAITRVNRGLCVFIGSEDSKLPAAFAKSNRFVVQVLAFTQKELEDHGAAFVEQGVSGSVSVERLHGKRLPYVDRLANLVVIDKAGVALEAGLTLQEIMRVVRPDGEVLFRGLGLANLKAKLAKAACPVKSVGASAGWVRVVAGWPEGMGVWTHQDHGADGFRVSKDALVVPPGGLRWIAGPSWSRSRGKAATVALLSVGGRNFYVTRDDSSNLDLPEAKAKWYLIARDAFNGFLHWKRP